jgi:Family of unknown function (DUF6365)
MKVLFVTPNSFGSGEAITAMQMGRQLQQFGHDVRFFSEQFPARFLAERFAGKVDVLPDDPAQAGMKWQARLGEFQPNAVVFADYPLLYLSVRGKVLLDPENWKALETVGARLFTLDHLGMARGPMTLAFGPPHFELSKAHLPALPKGMKVLLPCPINSPAPVAANRGVSFRTWDLPLNLVEARRREIRSRFLRDEGELLIFHSVPAWAAEFCRRHGITFYDYLTRLLEIYLVGLGRAVTIVSVNGGSLLRQPSVSWLRVLNLSHLKASEYDEILLASDLVLTDNRISNSLGKATCGLVPCVALHNSYRLPRVTQCDDADVRNAALDMERDCAGSVFPFEVFPIWTAEDMDALGIFRENPMARCMRQLEIFGGSETRNGLAELLTSQSAREDLRARQQEYLSMLERLRTGEEALVSMLD